MKFGMRTPSLKKSVKARTTGKLKRSIKKALIPGYGKKGMGWIKNQGGKNYGSTTQFNRNELKQNAWFNKRITG